MCDCLTIMTCTVDHHQPSPPPPSPHRCVVDIAHVASSILGRPGLLHRRTSLRGLCRQLLHVELDKSMQVSDWGQRPLSDAQVSGGGRGWGGGVVRVCERGRERGDGEGGRGVCWCVCT